MQETIYSQLASRLSRGEASLLRTELRGEAGRVSTGMLRTLEDLENGTIQPSAETREGTLTVREPVLPRERLLIFGGGHVGLALCEMAARCGFAVTVVDDRPAFAFRERFPWAEQVLCEDFVQAIARLHVGRRDYAAILTRGHAHDGDCLCALLKGPEPAYLGMIGSRPRVKAMRELLAREGFPAGRLAALHSPIGLSIGAVTPEEIAVSILAELIMVKRQGEPAGDLDLSVIEHLAATPGPRAVATVISAQGHTPRGAGAKLAVYPDGTSFGTVGGGYGEAAVLRAARECIGTGTYRILSIAMDSDVAQREGMACGGRMRVLIEDEPPAAG